MPAARLRTTYTISERPLSSRAEVPHIKTFVSGVPMSSENHGPSLSQAQGLRLRFICKQRGLLVERLNAARYNVLRWFLIQDDQMASCY